MSASIREIAESSSAASRTAEEAVGAGESGKGIAVVPNEVKELAQETPRATEDIARRVETIQADAWAELTTTGASTTSQAADDLSRMAVERNELVGQFRY